MRRLLLLFGLIAGWISMSAQTYCTSGLYTYGCTYGDDINNFTLGSFSQTNTGCSTGGYADYTSTPISVTMSQNYVPLTATTNYFSNEWFGVWVDWNDDGDFNDADEFVTHSTVGHGSSTPYMDSILIDASRPVGIHRMRVRVKYGGPAYVASESCSAQNYGEAHDYALDVVAPISGPNDATALSVDSPKVFCPGTQPVYASIANFGTNQITSVTVNWAIDGVTQTPVAYTSTLDTIGGTGSFLAQVQLGSATFAANTTYEVKVWTSNPNSVADTVNGNDTVVSYISPSMSGTYTINDAVPTGGTNFNSFGDAVSEITSNGVCGPIVLDVANGPYYEQVMIGEITGMNSINTITIQGNGASIIDSGSTGGNYGTFVLNGVDHLILDSLNIEALGSSNRMAVQFTNAADSNIIRNCSIKVELSANSSSVIAVAFSGSLTSTTTSGNNGNYNLIENNEIAGGFYGIRHYGVSSVATITGNKFNGNTVRDFYSYGIYNYYTSDVEMDGNDIHRMNAPGAGYATYFIYTGYTFKTKISNNWLHDGFTQATGSTSVLYGIYTFGSNTSVGNESKVYNNIISDMDNSGLQYLIHNSSSDGWWYYHNTLVTGDPTVSATGNTRLFNHTGTGSNIKFKNNILYLDRNSSGTNHAIYLSTSGSYSIDNNVYYVPGAGSSSNLGYYGTDAANFTAWKAINSSAFDQNGASGSPLFVDFANQDYMPKASYIDNIGANLLSEVPSDIYGIARTATPDPGAIEFTPPPGPDMTVLNVYSGGASCGTSTSIIVETLNQGTDTVTSFTINYDVNGVAQTPIAVTGVFPSGSIDSVTISGIAINATSITTVDIDITAVGPGTDTDPTNNDGTIDLRQGLSGTYTIDQTTAASSTNFVSFSSLAQALNDYGVCGNVVVNVSGISQVYTGRLVLNEISGTSSSSTITINGNGNTIQYLASDAAEVATVALNGADWVTIDSLDIKALGGSGYYGTGVAMSNNADHNTISNCTISVADDQSSASFAGITISGSLSDADAYGSDCDFNTIEGNTITGGYYGVTVYGESSDSTNGNSILNNIIQDFHYYGVSSYYSENLVVSGNDIHRSNRTTLSYMYGIRMYYASGANVIGNKIHDPFTQDVTNTSSAYGVYTYYVANSTLANNMVYNLDNDGYVYAVYMGYTSNTDLIHNTVILDDDIYTSTSTYTSARALYIVGAFTGGNISNNLFYYDQNVPGMSYVVYASGSISSMDNNAFYIGSNTPSYFGYYSGYQSSLGLWQASTGKDANSILTDPYLTDMANDDYTPQSMVIDGMGVDFTNKVASDINGASRNVPTDPGAIEFTGAACTGFAGIGDSATHNSATVSWRAPGQNADILWGPVGFMQASVTPDTVHVSSSDTSGIITGLASNACYDYYIQMSCTSTIPGAPQLMGPYTVCTECAGGALSGTYTVGGAAGPNNFATLDSVIKSLMGCGINGPVVFNLQGGTHNAFTLGQVDGISATNTITFNGSANYGDTISGTGQAAAIDLDGASHVTFNGLYAENTGSFVIWMHRESHHLTFDGCYFMGDPTSTSYNTGVFVASSSSTSASSTGDNTEFVTLTNSTIVGNYYGVSLSGGGSTNLSDGFEITNNTFKDQYYYSVYTYYTDSVLIEANQISDLRNTISYGINVYYTNNAEVLANEVYGAYYPIRIYYANFYSQAPTNRTLVANNMLQSDGGYGLYVYNAVNVDVFHNSVTTDGSYGLYVSGFGTTPQGLDIRNNIFENTSSGDAVFLGTVPPNTFMDYNLYESAGDITNNYATLAAWQAADTTWNQNSVQGSPVFVSTTDLHVLGTNANEAGDNSVGIMVDIDGDSRPSSGATTVDIGADEFVPVTADLSIINGEFVKTSKCLSSNDTIMLEVQNAIGSMVNFGTTSLTANYDVTGPVNTAGSVTINSGTLPAGDTVQVLGFPVDLSVPGVYTLNAWIDPSADNQTAANDTLTVSATITIYDTWIVTPDSTVIITNNTDTVELEAMSPFFTADSVFISEVSHYAQYGTGAGTLPSYFSTTVDDYIEITGVPGTDLEGITLEQWGTSMLNSSHTFPAGTVIGPNGTAIIMTGDGGLASSPNDYIYDGRGGVTAGYTSGAAAGRILRNSFGDIIDAVGYSDYTGSYTFPAAAGVTIADWSGNGSYAGGTAGMRLIGPDNNSSSNWSVVNGTNTQDAQVLNANVPLPSPSAVSGFDWKLNGTVVDTMRKTVVGPYTTSGVYEYIATFNGPCGVFTDTVTVLVNLPGSCPTPTNLSGSAPACDSIVVNWNMAADSALVAYVATGGTHGAGSLVAGDSTYAVAGLTPNTSYDFYVANICGGDTGMYAGPYTINSGSAGAPTANINHSFNGFGSLIYNFDASGSTGDRATYTWYFGDGNTGSGDSTSHTYAAGGSYTISLVVSNACGSDSTSIVIGDVGIGENVLSQSLKVYPNPAKDVLNIEVDFEGTNQLAIRILDMSGKQVTSISKDKKNRLMTESIDISNLSKGVYMIEVSAGQTKAIRRLIKE